MDNDCMMVMDDMMDALETAQGYAMIVTKHKIGNKEIMDLYASLSDHEMMAANKLHAYLVKKSNDPAMSEDSKKVYAWAHERAVKKMAEIKMFLDDAKRP